MILIKPYFQILTPLEEEDVKNMLQRLERHARVCYKSEDKITDFSYEEMLRKIIKRGHESVLEHENISVKLVVDRGITHEIVRHRICSFSQESTRYCNYEGGCKFIIPPWVQIPPGEYTNAIPQGLLMSTTDYDWFTSMLVSEQSYQNLLDENWTPQQARSVLPNSLKTEIDVTANLREWRHIFRLRTSSAAHPQMREIMIPLLKEFQEKIPIIFEDIKC